MDHFELRLLADYIQPAPPAVQAANTWNRPTPLAVGGELEQDERGEIVFMEIQPPVDGIGINDEDLRAVVVILDGHETREYISLSGIRSTLMAPPKERIWGAKLYSFGTPRSTNPLLNTTLKYKQNVTVACLAGPAAAGITGAGQGYRVRLWGYVYKTVELAAAFDGGVMQFPTYFNDHARGRICHIVKKAIKIDGDSWMTLPGGVHQGIPKINPFARFAYNALATDGQQGDYQFRFTNGGVGNENENLYFEFDEKDALLVEGLGVNASFDTLIPPGGVFPSLARTGLRIDGDYHPKGQTTRLSLFPTDALMNQLTYGWLPIVLNTAAPIAPLDIYSAIPKLNPHRPRGGYLIWNEIGMVVIRDNGVAVPPAPLGVTVALTGIRVEMRG